MPNAHSPSKGTTHDNHNPLELPHCSIMFPTPPNRNCHRKRFTSIILQYRRSLLIVKMPKVTIAPIAPQGITSRERGLGALKTLLVHRDEILMSAQLGAPYAKLRYMSPHVQLWSPSASKKKSKHTCRMPCYLRTLR